MATEAGAPGPTSTGDVSHDGPTRRAVLRSVAMLSAGTLAGCIGGSDDRRTEFDLTALTDAAAADALDWFVRTPAFDRLHDVVRADGDELDPAAVAGYRVTTPVGTRTVVTVPLTGDGELVLGRDDDTDDVVLAAVERRLVEDGVAAVEFRQPHALAAAGGLTTPTDGSSSDVVRTTLTAGLHDDAVTVTTDRRAERVTPTFPCWNCRILAALACDVGCSSSVALLCGLAGTLSGAVGVGPCAAVASRLCMLAGATGCGLSVDDLCCLVGDWCC